MGGWLAEDAGGDAGLLGGFVATVDFLAEAEGVGDGEAGVGAVVERVALVDAVVVAAAHDRAVALAVPTGEVGELQLDVPCRVGPSGGDAVV